MTPDPESGICKLSLSCSHYYVKIGQFCLSSIYVVTIFNSDDIFWEWTIFSILKNHFCETMKYSVGSVYIFYGSELGKMFMDLIWFLRILPPLLFPSHFLYFVEQDRGRDEGHDRPDPEQPLRVGHQLPQRGPSGQLPMERWPCQGDKEGQLTTSICTVYSSVVDPDPYSIRIPQRCGSGSVFRIRIRKQTCKYRYKIEANV